MSGTIQFGLIALIVFSALGAIFVAFLISRRRDLPARARRAFLLSNVSLILCLGSCVAGLSFYPARPAAALTFGGLAVIFLIVKFVFVRQFAHLIRQSRPTGKSSASVTQARQV